MTVLDQGLIQVYTGPGKGKTTAALGLAVRMLGAGGKVYVCQFCKPSDIATGEHAWARTIPDQLCWDSVDAAWDMQRGLADVEQISANQHAIAEKLGKIRPIAVQGTYDLMILDELVYVLSVGLAKWADVCCLLKEKAAHVELVLTGRGARPELIAAADLVTHMQEIKHPYSQGMPAREGVEY